MKFDLENNEFNFILQSLLCSYIQILSICGVKTAQLV